MSDDIQTEKYYTAGEICKAFDVSYPTANKLLDQIGYITLGDRKKVSGRDLKNFVQRNYTAPNIQSEKR
tara:strand:- start:15 stop:221 length:207 start_codon:yes stop_codon:yes gene_type:complete